MLTTWVFWLLFIEADPKGNQNQTPLFTTCCHEFLPRKSNKLSDCIATLALERQSLFSLFDFVLFGPVSFRLLLFPKLTKLLTAIISAVESGPLTEVEPRCGNVIYSKGHCRGPAGALVAWILSTSQMFRVDSQATVFKHIWYPVTRCIQRGLEESGKSVVAQTIKLRTFFPACFHCFASFEIVVVRCQWSIVNVQLRQARPANAP